tara:strand:- start:1662 stop:2561 length:900 start_codon:yes stop_codon:yes gene_type:complete
MRGDLTILLILGTVLLSSCQGGGERTNTGGIDLEFLKNQPPEEIYENSNFIVGLKLKNSLPEAVQGINVCVSDILSSEHQGIVGKECQSLTIGGAEHKEEIIIPEEEVIYFPKNTQYYSYANMDLGPDETTIFAEVTYPVKTTSTLDLCLKKDPTAEVEELSCETNTIFTGKDINSPFSPISVDKVESTITSEGNKNRIFLDVYFKKSSLGEVFYDEGDSGLMGFKISIGAKNIVFECNTDKEGYLEFNELSEMVTCNGLVELEEFIEVNSLNIEMSYDYKTKATKSSIKIRKLNQEAT